MPTEQKWSPEPWEIWSKGNDSPVWDAEGSSVTGVCAPNQANKVRIVSCVNACSGMSDPERQVPELKARFAWAIPILDRILQIPEEAGKPTRFHRGMVTEAKRLLAELEGSASQENLTEGK